MADYNVKYAYDHRETARLVEGLGYARGGDGMYRDSAGRPLNIEVRSSPIDVTAKAKLAIANDWQQAGIGTTIVDDPPSRRGDLEYRATFPGFDMSRVGSGPEELRTFKSSEARTPQNRYTGQNGSNYMNLEFDAMVDRYLTTIPRDERMRALGEVIHHMTDQVIVMDQFYDAMPTPISNRVANVAGLVARGRTNTWNVHLWEIR
jgi:ABC-type transport system substrate-binding protein